MKYDDQYSTCASTYATLTIYHDDLNPEVIDRRLGLLATSSQLKGGRIPSKSPKPKYYPTGGWFLESQGTVVSRDSRRHIDWILDQLNGKVEVIKELQSEGFSIVISCFWESEQGHGGPTIPPEQARRLADLGIELWFDLYFLFED